MIDTQQDNAPMNQAKDTAHCKHCHLEFASCDESDFCCHGCQLAYKLIRHLHLDQFYQIQKKLQAAGQKAEDPTSDQSVFEVYDHPSFQEGFCRKGKVGADDPRLVCELYVDGLSCYACVWLCEQSVAKFGHGTQFSVSLANGRGQLIFDPRKVKLSDIAYRLKSFGYSIAPNRDDVKAQHASLIRLGIAGFTFMNIMILALAEYVNGDDLHGDFLHLFRWISWALATMSLLGAGRPFYRNSIYALRKGELHLDLPISIAVIGAYIYSVWQLLRQGPYVYFDSLTAIVFLLSLGRFLQQSALSKHLRRIAMFQDTQLDYVRRQADDGSYKLVPFNAIKSGDQLQILARGIVPTNSLLLSDEANVNYESMTGEEKWVHITRNDQIRAGAEVGDQPIEIISLEDGVASALQSIAHAAKQLTQEKGSFARWSMRLSRYLTVTVLSVSLLMILLFLSSGDPHEGIRRAVSILLVACPCAFGLGVPLILTRSFGLGLKNGVLWNHPRAIEQLDDVSRFYFDKTGTLTEPRADVTDFNWYESAFMKINITKKDLFLLMGKLLDLSEHHINRALCQWAKQQSTQFKSSQELMSQLPEVEKETAGQGLALLWQGWRVKIGRYHFCCKDDQRSYQGEEFSYISVDDIIVARFLVGERYLEEAKEVLGRLDQQGRSIAILSGDSARKIKSLLKYLGLPNIVFKSDLSPGEKAAIIADSIESHKNETVAMVGNGINDSTALAQSALGIAVSDAADLAKKHADVVLVRPGIIGLLDALEISHRSRFAIKRVFGFSLLFNLLGIVLGSMGYISPAMAALLMPLSSLSVIMIANRF